MHKLYRLQSASDCICGTYIALSDNSMEIIAYKLEQAMIYYCVLSS